MSSCSVPRQPKPSRQLVIFLIATKTAKDIDAGAGRAVDLIDAATMAPHTIATFVLQEDGTPKPERWDNQRLRPDEFGLFRAMVAEMRLEYPTIPPMETMMERAKARLAGAGASLPGSR